MTSVDVEEAPSTILRIYIPKAKAYLDLDTGQLPNHVYQEMLVQGGKFLVNKGQTTYTKKRYPDPDELAEVALAKAKANLADLYAGKISIHGGAKEEKVPREVMTAARNIARKMVREVLKRKRIKVTQVKSSEVTKAANIILANDPSIIERARKELEDIEKNTRLDELDIGDIQPDPALVAAQEKRKSSKTLSAAQASRVTSRVR